jgi:hypothetical protein
MDRRHFLSLVAAGAAGGGACICSSFGDGRKHPHTKIPVVHVTDLFRPHIDPDDHWDLACVYALAYLGDIELKAVLIDHPPRECDPDVLAVAQMHFITGLAVPVVAGSSVPVQASGKPESILDSTDGNAVRTLLAVLRRSTSPVIINITGSCRDVAVAGRIAPELFAKKCAAVYVNAGNSQRRGKQEYNVSLDPVAYAAIFDLPCPVFWMPCFGRVQPGSAVSEFATRYRFRQEKILPHLSKKVRNYFGFVLGKVETSRWLQYLTGPNDEKLLAEHGARYRNMWCTAGFLHAAGKSVATDGRIAPVNQVGDAGAFGFEPARITCSGNGRAEWTIDETAKDRYIFRVRDVDHYPSAMTQAMKSLLTSLP